MDTVADTAEDPRDCKRSGVTLDTVYMDSGGIGIYIMYAIKLTYCKREIETTPFC
jgi:hypothetical protein